MNETVSLTREDRELLRDLNHNLKRLIQEKEKPVYLIKVKEVFALTIWKNGRDLERARNNGYIRQVRQAGSVYYDMNSIDPQFFVNKVEIGE